MVIGERRFQPNLRISNFFWISDFGFRIYRPVNWLLLQNSLLVSTFTTLLSVALGFLSALCLAGSSPRVRSFLLALAIMAMAMPPFLVTNCWLHYLGLAGVWRPWLPFNILSLGGTVWILTLLLWPIPLLALWSAWRRLEPAQLESDPAVTGWALIRALLVPLARTALACGSVFTFVLALNNFAVPAILQVKVSPAEMWVRFNTTFDTLGALEMSWPLVIGPLLLLFLFARREVPWPHLQATVSPGLFRRQLGPAWFWPGCACTILLCALSTGLPIFQLLSVERTWTELPGALAAGQSAISNSFWFAAVSATVVIALSLAAAQICATSSSAPAPALCNPCNPSNLFNSFLSWLLWLPFLIPGVLLGIGLITAFNRPWFSIFYQSAGIVILAFVIRYLALGWTGVAHALAIVDPDLTDSARLAGATRWQLLRHIQWPQIAPQVAAAWYIVFLLCLWDVESMILVVPPGGETLALRIFNLLHYGHNAQVNALCLTLLALAVTPLILWRIYHALPPSISRFTFHVSGFTSGVTGFGFQVSHVPRLFRLVISSFSNLFRISDFGFRILSVTFGIALLLGCSPNSGSNQAPLQSQLFSHVQLIGSRGVGVGQLNKPRSVAVDAQDNLYVVDMTGRVQKFSSNGVFLLSWQMPQTDLGKPKGMGRDRDGNIIVVEPHYQRVNFFSTAGRLVEQWGKRGTNAGELMLPRAVAVNSKDQVFVSEYGQVERVQEFAARGGKLLACLGHPGTGPGEFNRPEGLAVDSQDRIYVADSCNHRIQIFSPEGKFLRCYGQAGTGKGELSYPYDICVDAAGNQYVCEFGNSRIQVFDANDQPIEIIGGSGAEPGKFNNPWGVALDSAGNLYVADSQNHRVQKLIRKQPMKIAGDDTSSHILTGNAKSDTAYVISYNLQRALNGWRDRRRTADYQLSTPD
jgi:ABC-type Fe3+ transport system permease subunit/DNA-binding beta-propeller fold protein YncE